MLYGTRKSPFDLLDEEQVIPPKEQLNEEDSLSWENFHHQYFVI